LDLLLGLPPPADAAGALPLDFALATDKGANGSDVAVLMGFVAGGAFAEALPGSASGLSATGLAGALTDFRLRHQ
jgi:hypothetical protein